ncbi:hypothetical protein, partial [Aliivibrio sp.]|uniref:hypothetical protein n=1 Tax=Aliivibrio sp. TaxID=1872443 RepID=UPI003D2ED909
LGISSRYDGTSLSEPRLDNSWWGASLQADIDFSGMKKAMLAWAEGYLMPKKPKMAILLKMVLQMQG